MTHERSISRTKLQSRSQSVCRMKSAVYLLAFAWSGTFSFAACQAPSAHPQTTGASSSSATGSATPKPANHAPHRSPQPKRVEQTQPSGSANIPAPTAARISFEGGLLTVHAENSDLNDILRQVASASGMLIDGFVNSSRVYGAYGPGEPLNVLTELLNGSGYNFLMIGAREDGAPRELLLTQKSGEPLPPPAPRPVETQTSDDNSQGQQPLQAGPGAILNVPPPPSEDPQVRMQQNLQRLQQMHDHQAQPAPPQ